jgi:hypothetical protein
MVLLLNSISVLSQPVLLVAAKPLDKLKKMLRSMPRLKKSGLARLAKKVL